MLKCLVIDDEPLAIQLLANHISKVSFLELTGTFTNPMEALISFNSSPADLIFLDIQMPQLTGIQFMKLLQNRAQVVIASAYDEYAIDGFEHNVIDYLLKPIDDERLAVPTGARIAPPQPDILRNVRCVGNRDGADPALALAGVVEDRNFLA